MRRTMHSLLFFVIGFSWQSTISAFYSSLLTKNQNHFPNAFYFESPTRSSCSERNFRSLSITKLTLMADNKPEASHHHFNSIQNRRKAMTSIIGGCIVFSSALTASAQENKIPSPVPQQNTALAKSQSSSKLIYSDRYKIQAIVAEANRKQSPEFPVPQSTADLKDYNLTKSGVYFKDLKIGEGSTPREGDVIEINYVATVCDAENDGTYDCATATPSVEIYPNLPQAILKNSPLFDSSYLRGRTMKARIGGAQLADGLEEAIQEMRAGGSKLVLLTPDRAFACPKGRLCVSDLEAEQRLFIRVDLVSVGSFSSITN